MLNKLTKRQARKAYYNEETVLLCPNKLSPLAFDGAFVIPVNIKGKAYGEGMFDLLVDRFKWYNCNLEETGYQVSYYQE